MSQNRIERRRLPDVLLYPDDEFRLRKLDVALAAFEVKQSLTTIVQLAEDGLLDEDAPKWFMIIYKTILSRTGLEDINDQRNIVLEAAAELKLLQEEVLPGEDIDGYLTRARHMVNDQLKTMESRLGDLLGPCYVPAGNSLENPIVESVTPGVADVLDTLDGSANQTSETTQTPGSCSGDGSSALSKRSLSDSLERSSSASFERSPSASLGGSPGASLERSSIASLERSSSASFERRSSSASFERSSSAVLERSSSQEFEVRAQFAETFLATLPSNVHLTSIYQRAIENLQVGGMANRVDTIRECADAIETDGIPISYKITLGMIILEAAGEDFAEDAADILEQFPGWLLVFETTFPEPRTDEASDFLHTMRKWVDHSHWGLNVRIGLRNNTKSQINTLQCPMLTAEHSWSIWVEATEALNDWVHTSNTESMEKLDEICRTQLRSKPEPHWYILFNTLLSHIDVDRSHRRIDKSLEACAKLSAKYIHTEGEEVEFTTLVYVKCKAEAWADHIETYWTDERLDLSWSPSSSSSSSSSSASSSSEEEDEYVNTISNTILENQASRAFKYKNMTFHEQQTYDNGGRRRAIKEELALPDQSSEISAGSVGLVGLPAEEGSSIVNYRTFMGTDSL